MKMNMKIIGVLVGVVGLLLSHGRVGAEFSPATLQSVHELQSKILVQSRRNINAADASALWELFDQDVLKALNGGVSPLTAEALNRKYGWTDVQIRTDLRQKEAPMKTGGISIKFFPLTNHKERPDWLTVYYHGLGAVPSSTFHIFHYSQGQYQRAAAMELTGFLNQHPELLWHAIQIQMHPQKGAFSTYYVPPDRGKRVNRSEVRWKWTGKKLKARRWIPEVDFHQKNDGTVVSGRGPGTNVR